MHVKIESEIQLLLYQSDWLATSESLSGNGWLKNGSSSRKDEGPPGTKSWSTRTMDPEVGSARWPGNLHPDPLNDTTRSREHSERRGGIAAGPHGYLSIHSQIRKKARIQLNKTKKTRYSHVEVLQDVSCKFHCSIAAYNVFSRHGAGRWI